jgi:hypothetical protein
MGNRITLFDRKQIVVFLHEVLNKSRDVRNGFLNFGSVLKANGDSVQSC